MRTRPPRLVVAAAEVGIDLAVNADLFVGGIDSSQTLGSTMINEDVRREYATRMLLALSVVPQSQFHLLTNALMDARGAPVADTSLNLVHGKTSTLQHVSRRVTEESITDTGLNWWRMESVAHPEKGRARGLKWSTDLQTMTVWITRQEESPGGTVQKKRTSVRIEFRPRKLDWTPSEEDEAWHAANPAPAE